MGGQWRAIQEFAIAQISASADLISLRHRQCKPSILHGTGIHDARTGTFVLHMYILWLQLPPDLDPQLLGLLTKLCSCLSFQMRCERLWLQIWCHFSGN